MQVVSTSPRWARSARTISSRYQRRQRTRFAFACTPRSLFQSIKRDPLKSRPALPFDWQRQKFVTGDAAGNVVCWQLNKKNAIEEVWKFQGGKKGVLRNRREGTLHA
jgi:hypothetical protein